MKGIAFGNLHTYRDLKMILTHKTIGTPSTKTNLLDIPGGDGMLNRKIGFVCKSPAGRVVKLLQNYDSSVFTQEPEDLPAQWGFVWSNDPKHALPYVAISTSPYMTGNVCEENGAIYRSKMDNNVHAPSAYPQGWEAVE